MFLVALSKGRLYTDGSQADLWRLFEVCMLLPFFGLLRPIEVVQQAREHFALPGDAAYGYGHQVVITIVDPPIRASAGRLQFSVVVADATLQWTTWLSTGLSSEWRFSRDSTEARATPP